MVLNMSRRKLEFKASKKGKSLSLWNGLKSKVI